MSYHSRTPKLLDQAQQDALLLKGQTFAPFEETSRRWGQDAERFMQWKYGTTKVKTQGENRKDLRRFLKFIGERSITHRIMQGYVVKLQTDHPTRAERSFHTPKAFIRYLADKGRTQPAVLDGIRVRHSEPEIKKPITYQEYLKLREVAPSHFYEWLIMLGWNTGMSAIDCCLLTFKDVDMEDLVITRKRSKMTFRRSGKAVIPFAAGGELHEMFIQFARRERNETDYVCTELAIEQQKARVSNQLTGMLKKAGIKDKSFRSFRIAMATSLLGSGADVFTAMRALGHSNVKSTQRYMPENKEMIREAVLAAIDSRTDDHDVFQNVQHEPLAQPAPKPVEDDGTVKHFVPAIIDGGVEFSCLRTNIEPFRLWVQIPKTRGTRRKRIYVSNQHGMFYQANWNGKPISDSPETLRLSEAEMLPRSKPIDEKAKLEIIERDRVFYGETTNEGGDAQPSGDHATTDLQAVG